MKYIAATALLALALAGYLFWSKGAAQAPAVVACTEEAKIRLDGTVVGRVGPNCEFAACPAAIDAATTTLPSPIPQTASTTDLTLAVGQTGKAGRLFITLNRFLQDNRCPINVECVQAGAVMVNVTLAKGVHTETNNMLSDQAPWIFEHYRVAMTNISPMKRGAERIPTENYAITFRVEETTSQ